MKCKSNAVAVRNNEMKKPTVEINLSMMKKQHWKTISKQTRGLLYVNYGPI